jgi:RNase P subunit RPR2
MPTRRVPCPKCGDQLYRQHEVDTRFVLPSAWTCLQCGWRRTYTPEQFERRFALAALTGRDVEAGLSAGAWRALTRWRCP